MNIFSTQNIEPFISECADNRGETADRYSVGFIDGDVLCMSGDPTYAQGVSMWGSGNVSADDPTVCDWDELPDHIQEHVVSRMNEAYLDAHAYFVSTNELKAETTEAFRLFREDLYRRHTGDNLPPDVLNDWPSQAAAATARRRALNGYGYSSNEGW